MLTLILVLLVVLWLLGYIPVPYLSFLNTILFSINGHSISILNIFIFALILWLIGVLPNPFRTITLILFVLWLLSLLGIIIIATSFSQIILMALILGLVIYIIGEF